MATALSLDEIRRRCTKVVADWVEEPGDERQQAQSFIKDLLGAFGITQTKAALYEKRAKRTSTGRRGFIDALIPGLALIEMKTAGRDLEAAEAQALDYMEDLAEVERPSRVITSDFKTIRILDIEAEDGADTVQFPLEELPLHAEDLAFLAGFQTRAFGSREQEKASIRAAQIMGRLYSELEKTGYSEHESSVFLVRLLFALYGDDSGMWERDLFYEFLEKRTREDGTDLGAQLVMLFQIMNQPEALRPANMDSLLSRFPYVNGGIFGESTSIPYFDSTMRELLIEACMFNWSEISPAIFDSLFQSVKSSKARRQLGEHYTTEINILKTIEPLFLDELRTEFKTYYHDVKRLEKLRDRIGQLQVMDPACGCGNFLVVAYRELRQLDLKILKRLEELDPSAGGTLFFERENLNVKLENFAGIEIEEWPARIAQTALYLVDHQANQKLAMSLGAPPKTLPLDKVECIHVGNALRTNWEQVFPPSDRVRIVGNPPFIGQYLQGVDQTEDMQLVWGDLYDGYLDYVTGWYKKAADYFRFVNNGQFAFVSTNSITQGQPVPSLFGPLFSNGWRIKFAHQTFSWTSEAADAAAVHCVIIGMEKKRRASATLYTYADIKGEPTAVPAKNINAYLVDAPNLFVKKRSTPLSEWVPKVTKGSQPTDGGNLVVEVDEYPEVKADSIASKYLHRYVGARELLHGADRWCLWLEDATPADIQRSGILRDRLDAVREFRLGSKKQVTKNLADSPHLFAERRRFTQPYLCIPSVVSETRNFFTAARLDAETISSNLVFNAEDPDGYLFGIVSSSMFITWQKAIGGRLKSDLRFSNTVVWNNFPLPEVSEKLRAEIIAGGQAVLGARNLHLERCLADHYNPLAMSPQLLAAHRQLDKAVDRAFRQKPFNSNEERLETLLKSYLKLTEKDALIKTKRRR
ncbi:class I SAM-dependent DNA methyltransferase [Pauljensenia sp. UMB1235]|uniref:class I SAM-dependent DNA methyltransferase n=1 Tax=unclassified Pauljensenia TaxID=2908895 RepID=UPI00254F254A|nr:MULTISPECIES: DNA methyltransferase [unclassified Pauljensenia]MDK6400183.1 class I SAM-dependent DNA methyltransferase [Pauljensenia sp. UMB9872]MDK7172723.1 class I SAM-dependent DNA methyltransferase [Pauljensenia sp. UMB1235]